MVDPLAADVAGEQGAEAVPPVTQRLVADVDTPLGQQVLDVPQGQRILTYSMTARRITSGELLKYRNGYASPQAMDRPFWAQANLL